MKLDRRFLVPEVVQISATDCGPAALTALLGGFGISVDYQRIRETCRTDRDGTSIDTLEDLALMFGLDAEQVLVPLDHVVLREAGLLPGIVVVRHPGSFIHGASGPVRKNSSGLSPTGSARSASDLT